MVAPQNNMPVGKSTPTPTYQLLNLSAVDTRKTLSRVSPRKAAGPDSIPGQVRRECADQLVDDLKNIFSLSLNQANHHHARTDKNSLCAALTSMIIKCFERVVMEHLKSSFPTPLDPFQYVTVWYGNCTDCKTLQWIVRTTENVINATQPIINISYRNCYIHKATSIADNPLTNLMDSSKFNHLAESKSSITQKHLQFN